MAAVRGSHSSDVSINSKEVAVRPQCALKLAEQLVAAGMPISFTQMTAASSSMVAGAEVWLQAQLLQRVEEHIPPAAVKLFEGTVSF
jgi:hypothetical protein